MMLTIENLREFINKYPNSKQVPSWKRQLARLEGETGVQSKAFDEVFGSGDEKVTTKQETTTTDRDNSKSPLLARAKAVWNRGGAVVPIIRAGYSYRKDGVEITTGGKSPWYTAWQKKRLSWPDLEKRLRDPNIVALGIISGSLNVGKLAGLGVLDYDGEGWAGVYENMLEAWDDLTRTVGIITGSGKRHKWLKLTNVPDGFTNKKFIRPDLEAAVELRYDESNNVFFGLHPSGGCADWECDEAELVEIDFVELYDWLADWQNTAVGHEYTDSKGEKHTVKHVAYWDDVASRRKERRFGIVPPAGCDPHQDVPEYLKEQGREFVKKDKDGEDGEPYTFYEITKGGCLTGDHDGHGFGFMVFANGNTVWQCHHTTCADETKRGGYDVMGLFGAKADLDKLLQQAVDAPKDETIKALCKLAAALAESDPLVVNSFADRVSAANLSIKGAFLESVKEHSRRTNKKNGKELKLHTGISICITGESLVTLTEAAWKAILKENASSPRYFRYGGLPARIELDDKDIPIIQVLDLPRMTHALARAADWYKVNSEGEKVATYPPKAVVQDVLATPNMPLPILTAIVNAPVFAADGVLSTEPGYHDQARVFYSPSKGFKVPEVPEVPSKADLSKAKDLLLKELMGEFPFVGEAEIAHAMALVLLPFIRPMINGPTPLHLIEKPSPGTGGSLLVNSLLYPSIGQPVTAMTEGRSEDEWRKRLTAKLLGGASVVFIDNLSRRLSSPALSATITAPIWEDRVLGTSKTARIPIRCTWVATGNNPTVSNEIARRTVRIRLDAKQDRPWLRYGFKHPDLYEWVKENRPQLAWAALTIVQNWIAEGKTKGNCVLGMFQNWADTMGGILDAAEIPGFLGNLTEFYDLADAESAAWRALVAIWWDAKKNETGMGTEPVGTAFLYPLVIDNALDIYLGDGTEQSQKTRLGKAIGRQRDKRYTIAVDDKELTLKVAYEGKLQRLAQWALLREQSS